MYRRQRCIIFALVIAALSFPAETARACPYCRVATGSMADEATQQDADHPDSLSPGRKSSPFSIAMGVDVPTAYFYRGYLQQDRGAIAQPYLTLSGRFSDQTSGLTIQPYVSWWNSIHSESIDRPRGGHGRHSHVSRVETRQEQILVPGDPSNPEPHFINVTSQVFFPGSTGTGQGWYEAELSAGGLLTYKDWWIDLSYHVHLYPADTHDAVQEMNAKISYDVAGFWDNTPTAERKFSLRPYVLVARELNDQNGDENTYIELGAEPTWRFRLFKHSIALSTPVLVGLSPDGVYYEPNAGDETVGYASGAIKASIALQVPPKFGHWFLNGSVTYLRLIADSTIADNRGERNEVIGSIGVGVSF